MKIVAQILKSKTRPGRAHRCAHGLGVRCLKLMADENIGALLVMQGEAVAGIVTERDYARKIILMETW